MKVTDPLAVALRYTSTATRGIAALRPRPHDAFYEATDDLADAAPGEVLKAEKLAAYISPGVRMRARAWRILYRSTSAVGEPTAVSGTVLIPPRPHRAPRPLVAYAIGTHGLGDVAAPSYLLPRGLDFEAGPMAMALARGWGLVVTDYQGLGTPGDHTYMVGRALGPNVLDSLRAARGLHPDEFPADGPAGIIGFSEGGYASAWAGQIQPSYAPDVALVGVAPGAAVCDTAGAAKRLDGSFFSFFAAYGAIGYAAAYPELELEPYLTDAGRRSIPILRRSSVAGAALYGPHFARAEELTSPNVMELPEWQARLQENTLGETAPDAPVLLWYARNDNIVHYDQGTELLRRWKAAGGDVRMHTIRGAVDHVSALVTGLPSALTWLGSGFRAASSGQRWEGTAPARPSRFRRTAA